MATSAMEAAAEAAAAKASARDHPNARQVEERAVAVQATTERALAVLEQRLRLLITRKASERSPRYSPRLTPTSPLSLADARGVRRMSLSSPLSAFSSPSDYAKSPESPAPQASGSEQQRWVAAAPEGSIMAPLVAAAILLMDRAWARHQSLVVAVQDVQERAFALAVGEAGAAAARGPAVAGGDGVRTAAVAAAGTDPVGGDGGSRSPLSSPPSPSPFGMTDRQRSSAAAADPSGLAGQWATSTGPPRTHVNGLANLSCCADFERILGEENDSLPEEDMSPLPGGDRAAPIGSSVLRARGSSDKGKPLSDSSMIAERSFSGFDQHNGGGETLRFTGSVDAPTMRPTADTWPAVFEDVAIAEERGLEVVGIWDTAGGALKDACEELMFEEADRRVVKGLAAQ